jgi:hypothetical protein
LGLGVARELGKKAAISLLGVGEVAGAELGLAE